MCGNSTKMMLCPLSIISEWAFHLGFTLLLHYGLLAKGTSTRFLHCKVTIFTFKYCAGGYFESKYCLFHQLTSTNFSFHWRWLFFSVWNNYYHGGCQMLILYFCFFLACIIDIILQRMSLFIHHFLF
jgi:hypothetical protein